MNDLTILECSRCQGEGYLLSVGRPGEFSEQDMTFLPSESCSPCPECEGQGEIEVCVDCLESFVIRGGEEVCRCEVLELPQAA